MFAVCAPCQVRANWCILITQHMYLIPSFHLFRNHFYFYRWQTQWRIMNDKKKRNNNFFYDLRSGSRLLFLLYSMQFLRISPSCIHLSSSLFLFLFFCARVYVSAGDCLSLLIVASRIRRHRSRIIIIFACNENYRTILSLLSFDNRYDTFGAYFRIGNFWERNLCSSHS